MATPPLKPPQPLHNFALPNLKWAHKHSSAVCSSNHQTPPHHVRRCQSPDQHNRRCPDADPYRDASAVATEEENIEAKPWNLRPRKEIVRTAPFCTKEAGDESNGGSNGNAAVKSQRLRGFAEGGRQNGVERKTKRKLWISLSREEIEEDIYALTGGKPARRPRKWPKNVQKQLDFVFPGLYLIGVAAETYRVMMLWYGLLIKSSGFGFD